MRYLRQLRVVGLCVGLVFSGNVALAAESTVAPKGNYPPAYTLYLQQMKKFNAERRCANLPPMPVYGYPQFKQTYSK